MQGSEGTSDRFDLLGALRRRAWLIALCALLVAAVAYLLSEARERRYEATALLGAVQEGGPTLPGRNVEPQPEREETTATLVASDAVFERTAKRLGVPLDKASVNASHVKDSDTVRVTATATQAELAAALANTFAQEYVADRRRREKARLRKAMASIRAALKDIRTLPGGHERRVMLGQRIDDLRLQIDVATGGLEVAEKAGTPTEPKSPRPRRDAALGGLFGLVLGGALALLWAQADRRVREVSELQGVSELPVLGTIPQSPALRRKEAPQLRPDDAEAFRVVQANTRFFNRDEDIRSLIVTSAAPGEGKTTVAWNMAVAAASGGMRVLLIEADLRRPCLVERYGLTENGGLTSALVEDRKLADVVQEVPIAGGGNGNSSGFWMEVVTAGRNPPNPAGLIASDRMRAMIAQARDDHDLIVLDTPPVPVISDAIPLLREVDGVIVVSYLGVSTRDAVLRLLTQLRHLDVNVLGLVANGASRGEVYSYR